MESTWDFFHSEASDSHLADRTLRVPVSDSGEKEASFR